MTDEQWKNAVRGRFYRPVKKQVTALVDADVLHWLKKEGRGYQSRMNAILRREMLASMRPVGPTAPKAAVKTEPAPRRRKALASGK